MSSSKLPAVVTLAVAMVVVPSTAHASTSAHAAAADQHASVKMIHQPKVKMINKPDVKMINIPDVKMI